MNRSIQALLLPLLLSTVTQGQQLSVFQVQRDPKDRYSIEALAKIEGGKILDLASPGDCTRNANWMKAQELLSSGKQYYLYSTGKLIGRVTTFGALSPTQTSTRARLELFQSQSRFKFPLLAASSKHLGHSFSRQSRVSPTEARELEDLALSILASQGHQKLTVENKRIWKIKIRKDDSWRLVGILSTEESVGIYPHILLIAGFNQARELVAEFVDSQNYYFEPELDQLDITRDNADELFVRDKDGVVVFTKPGERWDVMFRITFTMWCR